MRRGTADDQLLTAQVARFDRTIDSAAAECRRVADLYQTGFIEREELLRRGKELEARRRTFKAQCEALIAQLAQHNRRRARIEASPKVRATIDKLDFDQRQKLLRLVVAEVRARDGRSKSSFAYPWTAP